MVLAKAVSKYIIIVSLLYQKSTEYDYTLRGAFSFHNTRETYIAESAPVR